MNNLSFKSLKAFTLVELIVVITIIAILGTVWFVSYSNYLTGARDSNRISQLTKISDALQVYSTSRSLPLPDTLVDIQVWWNVVWYQWDLWESVLQTIDYSTTAKDPKDNTPFIYYVWENRSSFQLMTFMEEQKSLSSWLSQSFAADYKNRFPKSYGRRMGILLENDSNIPLQNIYAGWAIELVTHFYATAYLSDTVQIVGNVAWDLLESSPIASCKRRREAFWENVNGVYKINPAGTEISVYCEMNEQWGGWTLAARSVVWGTWTFTWNTAWGSIDNLSAPYVLWGVDTLSYKQIMLASYQTNRTINIYKIVDSATWGFALNTPHTLSVSGITGWTPWDGYNGLQGMIFVK